MHFYGWKNGLKTGQYYLRSRPSRDAIKFTVNIEALLKATDSGNSEDIVKCLTKNNQEDNAVMRKKQRTDDTMETGEPDLKKRKLNGDVNTDESNNSNSANGQQEPEEDVIFECLNCSG